MRIQQVRLLCLVFIAIAVHGCATLMQGSTQQITVNSSPSGATVLVDGGLRFTTPTVLELSRKESHRIEISLEGYHPERIDVRTTSSNMVMGNIVAGGLVGFVVDHSSGAAFRLVPEVVRVSLRPITAEPENTPTVSDNRMEEASVDRQN
jgi:hypothetical protein